MSSTKSSGKKKRLGKAGKQTRWAPFWLIPKSMGKGKKVHPSHLTKVKRDWKRDRIQA